MQNLNSCSGGEFTFVVKTQADANALPAVLLGSLFIRDVTEAIIDVQSTEIKGSLYVSHLNVTDGTPHFISFPNLTSIECDLVIGQDTQWPDSNGQIVVDNTGSELTVQFNSLETVGGDVVVGTKAPPGSPLGQTGIHLLDSGKQFITFSNLDRISGSVVVGSLGTTADYGMVIENGSEQHVKADGGFTVDGDVVVGLNNVAGGGEGGNSIFASIQNLSIACKDVRGLLVCGKYGGGKLGNSASSLAKQTIEFPLLENVARHVVVGHFDPALRPTFIDGNLLTNGSQGHVKMPLLAILSSSLTIGTNVPESAAGNWIHSNSAQNIDLSSLKKVKGNVTIGGDGSGGSANLVQLATQTANLENLQFISGFLNVCNNDLVGSFSTRYSLVRLCCIGKHLRLDNNDRWQNLSHLGWEKRRPLRCIGGPLQVRLNNLLENIDGLSTLTSLRKVKTVTVSDNTKLGEFCGLFKLANDPDVTFEISGNLTNPTKAAIAAAGPCPRKPCFPICCPDQVTVQCE